MRPTRCATPATTRPTRSEATPDQQRPVSQYDRPTRTQVGCRKGAPVTGRPFRWLEAQRHHLEDARQPWSSSRDIGADRIVDGDQRDGFAAGFAAARLKVAMLIPFSPSLVPSAPMKPGASVLTI